jgi:hypothetical protein
VRRAPLVATLLTVIAGASASARAETTSRRYAVVIGANLGERGDVPLRYAELDAQRVAETLRVFGEFPADQVLLLAGVTGADVRDALIRLNARLRDAAPGALLFVYYSGHADEEGLRLNGSRLRHDDLRALVTGSPAETRVLIVDACRSGSATRVKGAHPAPTFDVVLDAAPPPKGVAILTSSTESEDSQESDALRGSFFTYYFNSALIGAGDQNGDGRVTLGEAFAFASDQTVQATIGTAAGPQHPTYRVEMGGRQELVLTRPQAGHVPTGTLAFSDPGRYFVHRLERAGGPAPVAEVVASGPGAQVAVPPGRYLISARGEKQLLESEREVDSGRLTYVSKSEMKRYEYARMVRKGIVDAHVWSAGLAAGAHSSYLGLGSGLAAALALRVDWRRIALEGRVSLERSEQSKSMPALDFKTNGLAASLVAVRPFDRGPVTIAPGIEAGVAVIDQTVSDVFPPGGPPTYVVYPAPPGTRSVAGVAAPLIEIEAPLPDRVALRIEAAAPVYAVEAAGENGSSHLNWAWHYRAMAGLAFYF